MPTMPLPHNVSFDPDQIRVITSAYEKACLRLQLTEDDPRSEQLAKQIISLARDGEHNADRLCDLALREQNAP